MNKYLLGGAAAAVMVAVAPALAQVAAPAPVAPMMQNYASHGRAKVETRAEVAAHVRTMFDRLDSNRDGAITKVEAEAASAKAGQWAERRMHDGAAGGQMAGQGAMFDRLDANHDGAITRGEFDALHARHQQKVAMRDQNGAGRPEDGRKGGRGMRGMAGHMFEAADSNNDGRVTLQEATNAALQHFDMADINRDGQLTPDERMQMHQRTHAEHKPG